MAEKEVIKYSTPSKVSRYWNYTFYKDETNIFISDPRYLEVPEHPDDQYFMVTPECVDRIDLIAAKFYENVILWWVIAKANHLENPLCIPLDTILRIPSIHTLYGEGGLVSGA